MKTLLDAGELDGSVLTASGKALAEILEQAEITDPDVIRPYDQPLRDAAGLIVLSGNLFDSAVMKTSVISTEFRKTYLNNPDDPEAFEGIAVVFDGPEDYHSRIDNPDLQVDERSILIIRGAGPVGYPGGAEVVNMRPPQYLIQRGITELPCIGDGRQSGTSGSPSILNAAPEAAVGGGLALVQTGDRIRIDIKQRRVDMLVPDEEIAARRVAASERADRIAPPSQTPWQAIQRSLVGQFDSGAILEEAASFQRIAQTFGVPRDSH
jgi:dihydroxy-acid dehydratase